jgi:hypothetical protein
LTIPREKIEAAETEMALDDEKDQGPVGG